MGARRRNTSTIFDDQTVPEPDNLFDHYEGRAEASPPSP